MTSRAHPGYPWPTPPEWKQKVLRALEANEREPAGFDRPRTKADLARAVKTTTANMSILLEGPTRSSELVPAIHRALGWAPPQSYWTDERDLLKAEIDAHWEDLTEQERKLIKDFVELTKRRKPFA
jgi:hypothetical protein